MPLTLWGVMVESPPSVNTVYYTAGNAPVFTIITFYFAARAIGDGYSANVKLEYAILLAAIREKVLWDAGSIACDKIGQSRGARGWRDGSAATEERKRASERLRPGLLGDRQAGR